MKVSISLCFAQFAPAAGQPGTTAIKADSSIIVAWANSCEVVRGLIQINLPDSGFASAGTDSSAIGPALQNGVLSLGDGGQAICTFAKPVTNGSGWDFVVFENGFSDDFLELAFVEVSSDGIHFFRFPAVSLTSDSFQIGSFGLLQTEKIHNLGGKYRAGFGTPFDLAELEGEQGLNLNQITHIKVIDVVGRIKSPETTFDSQGNAVNDPWPTPFPSGGFDLDAIGIIHEANVQNTIQSDVIKPIHISPNPSTALVNIRGRTVKSISLKSITTGQHIMPAINGNQFSVASIASGFYFIDVFTENDVFKSTLVVQHEN